MMAQLTEPDLPQFEQDIRALIERSQISAAEDRVREAIRDAGTDSLRAASEVPDDAGEIDGWRLLGADLMQADDAMRKAHGERVRLLVLGLENDQNLPRLQFLRSFHARYKRRENGFLQPEGLGPPSDRKPIYINGLDALMTAQRSPWPRFDAAEEVWLQAKVDHLLAGLLLIVKIHQIFDRTVAALGLPLPIDVILDTLPSQPYPLDYHDLGPAARRFIAAASLAITRLV